MKLKEIHRTSTFAWSPTASLPLLATGTVAGALDESFSNESQLEIWAPNFLDRGEFDMGISGQNAPNGVVKDSSRFNRLAWGAVSEDRPHGVIAAGMENGELSLWDPSKILVGTSASESLILRNTTHTGPVRGLDFNPIQTSLLASGGVSGEVYIWDLKDPSKPYTPTPGARSTKLDEITCVAWNQQVQYVLAGASSTGYTVVWDLRGKREVVALAYGGGAGTLAGQTGGGSGMAVGGRRGMSDIAWHPDNATRLVTASEDDTSPIIMVWDLRNARAPEKILTGHEKGVLSLSWCKQDADLLLSCGKDNRALCWNPQTSEVIGELPSANNWAFQVDWCPRNPDLFAAAFFDGTIGIHSIQSTNEAAATDAKVAQRQTEGADIFDSQGLSRTSTSGTLSLKQPPKWLRRPAGSSFGFGGQLVTISNLSSVQGKNQSSVVHLRKVVTEQALVSRAARLLTAIECGSEALKTFAEERSVQDLALTKAGWKALLSLFKADSREELVTLLGFSKTEIVARVAEVMDYLKASTVENKEDDDEMVEGRTHEPVVSFAEPERDNVSEGSDEKTPSEISLGVTSDTNRVADNESSTTVPSLFGDDGPGTPQLDTGSDFFSTFSQGQNELHVPHTNYGLDSSVAATVGSGPSSVTSEILKDNSFRIYPADESDTDRLVTKALVLGDFESAVTLCLSSNRFADAILLAVRGGPELLQNTQKAYFERRTTSLPYLRLFQSIVTNDLSDIVQNADLQEWREIFVVLCTFAGKEEFAGLAEQLGRRLEFQFSLASVSEDVEAKNSARDYRQNATLTYLAAARLERLVNIWIDELSEEENQLVSDEVHLAGSHYSAHTQALQSFVEKVTVFRSATKYRDADLLETSGDNVDDKEFKLAGLYDRYLEYAELLTTQGLVKEAIAFLDLTPKDYKGSNGIDFSAERARLITATGSASAPPPAPSVSVSKIPAPTTYAGYSTYSAPTQPAAPTRPPSVPAVPYHSYNPVGGAVGATTSYTPVNPQLGQAPYIPAAPSSYMVQNSTYQSLTQPPHLRPQVQNPTQVLPPPPPRASTSNVGTVAPPTPPKRQENGGWNDAPVVTNRATSAMNLSKPAAITAPFPNQVPTPGFSPGAPYTSPGQATTFPPPPRPGSVPAQIHPPPPGRPASRPAVGSIPPPPRMMSPSQAPHLPRQPTPSKYGSPPPRAPVPGQTPPPPQPGPYNRLPLPGQQKMGQPPAPSAYAPPVQSGPYSSSPQAPPHQQLPPQQGPYAPPPGMQRPGPHPPQGPSQIRSGTAPPPSGPAQSGPPPSSRLGARPAPAPKYPAGDRSHIPGEHRPAYNIISELLNRLKQTTPPQQKRWVDDLERRINPLFDALNCETLSKPVVDQLLVLARAMENHDRAAALAIHVELLTRESSTDDIALWLSGVKQLIMRL